VISRTATLFLVLAFSCGGCARSTSPGFIVSAKPLDVGIVHPVCIAVDVNAEDGVWWWQPGASGCDSRSTGPTVFHADAAKVRGWHMSRGYSAEFQVQLMGPRHSTQERIARISLVLRDGTMTAVASRATVPTVVRKDLEIPEKVRQIAQR
jgi:hypothetical protein